MIPDLLVQAIKAMGLDPEFRPPWAHFPNSSIQVIRVKYQGTYYRVTHCLPQLEVLVGCYLDPWDACQRVQHVEDVTRQIMGPHEF